MLQLTLVCMYYCTDLIFFFYITKAFLFLSRHFYKSVFFITKALFLSFTNAFAGSNLSVEEACLMMLGAAMGVTFCNKDQKQTKPVAVHCHTVQWTVQDLSSTAGAIRH